MSARAGTAPFTLNGAAMTSGLGTGLRSILNADTLVCLGVDGTSRWLHIREPLLASRPSSARTQSMTSSTRSIGVMRESSSNSLPPGTSGGTWVHGSIKTLDDPALERRFVEAQLRLADQLESDGVATPDVIHHAMLLRGQPPPGWQTS